MGLAAVGAGTAWNENEDACAPTNAKAPVLRGLCSVRAMGLRQNRWRIPMVKPVRDLAPLAPVGLVAETAAALLRLTAPLSLV